MQFDTKIAVVVRTDLEVWQKLNVASFLAGGVAAAHDEAAVAAHMEGRHVEIDCDLGLGSGRAVVLGTDLSYGYIDENRTTS